MNAITAIRSIVEFAQFGVFVSWYSASLHSRQVFELQFTSLCSLASRMLDFLMVV